LNHILLAENDFPNFETLRLSFEKAGYLVFEAATEEEVIDLMRQVKPAVILLRKPDEKIDELYAKIYKEKSNRLQLENDLKLAGERVKGAESLINEFLSKISHEIRTPINTLQQAAKQLESDLSFFNNKDIIRLTSIMVEDSERLSRTIDLLLNISQIRSGTYRPKIEKFDLFHEVLSQLIARYKLTAEKKKLRFMINSSTLHCVVNADKYSVIQIFSNLIDNAITFTERGIIEIDIHKLPDGSLQVSIIDTGIGMKPEFVEQVFRLFSQESSGYSRNYDGTGLGLPLVKGFCDLNNIEISIQSQKDAGTVVTLKFS
jgi:signal transduction histidine kinase